MSDTNATDEDIVGTPVSEKAPARSESRWAWMVAVLAVLSTLVPYLLGASMADGRRFMWLAYNLDDSCSYLALMRQAAEGSYRALNLFTTEPQHGMALNPLFLVLGRLAGWTHLPLIAVYHGARLLFGLALLRVVWHFILQTVGDAGARKLAFLFVCFSSGLGWIPAWWNAPLIQAPIDKWQPEAITYLSLYLSPLFCFAMALQVGILSLLLRGVRTGKIRYAIAAGLCGLLLGAVHTYDIVSLTAVWLVYLILGSLPSRKAFDRTNSNRAMPWLQALTAGAITLPSVLYIYLQLMTEAVFRERAVVPTLSPLPFWVLAGYGGTALLAFLGFVVLLRRTRAVEGELPQPTEARWTVGGDATRLLLVWAVINVGVAYIPTAIQRKLLQGAHFPIAIVAGIGAAWLLMRLKPTARPWQVAFKMAGLTFLLSLTNILVVLRDVDNYNNNRAQTMLQRTYLQPGELEALEWIRDHSKASDAIQPLPWVVSAGARIGTSDESAACFAPGLINRRVYCGHWGETPDFGGKLQDLRDLEWVSTSEDVRKGLLRKMKVRYLLFSQKPARDSSGQATDFADAALPVFRGHAPLPSYLQLVHSNDDADVYEVTLDL